MHRQVETIAIADLEFTKHRYSVDFTVPRQHLGSLSLNATGQWVLPIGAVPKSPLRDFDIDYRSQPLSLITRREYAQIAESLATTTGERALAKTGEVLNPSTRTELVRLALEGIGERRKSGDRPPSLDDELKGTSSNSQLLRVLDDKDALWLVNLLTSSRLLVPVLPECDGRQLLKYSLKNDLERGTESWWQAVRSDIQVVGGGTYPIEIDLKQASWSGGYHVEIELPDELCVNDGVLESWRVRDGVILDSEEDYENPDNFIPERHDFAGREERICLYGSSIDKDAETDIYIELKPNRAGLPAMSLLATTFSASVLWFSYWLNGSGSHDAILVNPNETTISLTVASATSSSIILAVTALFAGSLFVRDGASVVSRIMRGARALLGLSSFSAISAATAVGFADSGEWSLARDVWLGACIVATVCLAVLALFAIRAIGLRRIRD